MSSSRARFAKRFARALLAASLLLGTAVAAEATSVELYDPTRPGAEDESATEGQSTSEGE